jgi:RNA polymerase sigma-70 factor (ECF subfamily)
MEQALGSGPAEIERLARAAATGDPRALNELLVATRPEVLRLCARFLPNREDAEEACQDTLLALARGIGQFEGRSSFRTWLHRLAANRARSTYQSLRRRSAGEMAGALLPDRPDPRRTSVIAGTRLDLLDALEGLSADYATLLGVPEGTVKSRIHEARRRLRQRLDGPRNDLREVANKSR